MSASDICPRTLVRGHRDEPPTQRKHLGGVYPVRHGGPKSKRSANARHLEGCAAVGNSASALHRICPSPSPRMVRKHDRLRHTKSGLASNSRETSGSEPDRTYFPTTCSRLCETALAFRVEPQVSLWRINMGDGRAATRKAVVCFKNPSTRSFRFLPVCFIHASQGWSVIPASRRRCASLQRIRFLPR